MQQYKSAATSINSSKLPAAFKVIPINAGDMILDIGGGKFDNAVEYAATKDAELVVYDPYNRTQDHNEYAIAWACGKVNKVVCNNVLNVIMEHYHRKTILLLALIALKDKGELYISVYEGDKSGEGKATQNNQSWQNNMRLKEYLNEVKAVFPNAVIKKGCIVAKK